MNAHESVTSEINLNLKSAAGPLGYQKAKH